MSIPLIEKIEIRSFRSVYEAQLESCKPLNILVGGNDSGKSNILRALNLFFNGETDLQIYHDWRTDYSLASDFEQNMRHHKKAIEIKVTFNNIFNYPSLPEKFEVRKTWDREGLASEPTYTGTEEFNKNILTRFLNKITLHYIPGIKDQDTFAHYLEKIHDALSEKRTAFSNLFKSLQESINDETNDLSNRIQKALGMNSRIVFPADLKEIFGDLDFATQLQGGYEKVSLHQRGDGIQVRHIPYILDFISEESEKRKFIWLYEEPENSLELRRAFDLAQAFKNDFSKRNQIFLTTHSPAFYSLEGDDISRYQVIKEKKSIISKKAGTGANSKKTKENFSISRVSQLTQLKDIDESLGLTVLVADRAKEAYNQLELLTKEIERFKKQTKPLILCEGKTDVMYIKTALELSGKGSLLSKGEIMEVCRDSKGSGCENLKKLYSLYEKSPQLSPMPILLVFDCDVSADLEDTGKVSIFKFKKQQNPEFPKGIENSLSLDVSQQLSDNNVLWELTPINEGYKKGEIKILNKVKAAEFVHNRKNKADFALFSDLIQKIEVFLKSAERV